jgi:murein DD-endopeptidase MepM/ murein hydrolase activator NlpD
MEFVVAMLWFNPFVFVLLRYVRDNHEYLADHYAHGTQGSLREYLECLREETVRYFSPVPASYFNSSTIKKRIIMLTTYKSNRNKKWRYLGVLPLLAILVVVFHTPAEQSLAVSAPGPLIDSNGAPSQFPLPEKYLEKITWGFDQTAIHPINKKKTTHMGIDVAAPAGTPVFAMGDGVVKKAVEEKGWGKMIVLDHGDGYATFYGHLDEIKVEAGVKVRGGEVIGKVGNTGQSTGPHLHFEVRLNGQHLNPADFY